MSVIELHYRPDSGDEEVDEIEMPDDATDAEIDYELVQWVLDHVDHWWIKKGE